MKCFNMVLTFYPYSSYARILNYPILSYPTHTIDVCMHARHRSQAPKRSLAAPKTVTPNAKP